MNVIYEKRRHERAVEMKKKEQAIREENIQKREEAKMFEAFKAKVKSDDSGLSLLDLKKLNSVYKREYMKIIIEDEALTAHVLNVIDEKVENQIDEVIGLEYGIQDTKDVWDNSVQRINEAI